MVFVWDYVITRPLTVGLTIVLTLIWLFVNQYVIPVESVSFHMESVIDGKEYWRCVTSQLTHYSIIHLAFNVVSLNGFFWMESAYGRVEYLKFTFIIILFSFVVQVISYSILIRYGYERYRNIHGIGYSCVIFGLMMVASMKDYGAKFHIFGFQIPMFFMPYFSLIVTQLIIPRASFIGHLSGIIAAFPIVLGFFFWYTDFLFYISVFWIVFIFAWSLKRTKPDLPVIRLISTNQPSEEVTIENNILTHETTIPNIEFEVVEDNTFTV